MRIDRQKVVRVFNAYVENYNRQDEKVRLKIEHTYRVSRLCEEIAVSLCLSQEDISLAWFLGMLHDIGRFEQLKNYGTFIDAESIDHAGYGAEILFSQGKIRDFLEDCAEDKLIETAIACHNAYRLPEGIDERTEMFCQILRDADKIDILKVNVEFPLEEIYNVTTSELYNCTVSGEVMEAFREGHTVLRTLKKTTADHVVGHISLVYGLVYDKSLSIIKEQGYIYKLMDFKSDNPQTCKQFEQIREIMNKYLGAEMRKNMKEYKNYIFDLYGTLVDIHTDEEKDSLWKNMAEIYSMMGAAYTAEELKKQYKKLAQEELDGTYIWMSREFGNRKLEKEEIEILLDNIFAQLFHEKKAEVSKGQIWQAGVVFRCLSTEYIRMAAGVPELISRLKQAGKKIYLLSNAQRNFTEPEMKMLGIYGCFDGILYSSDAGVKKPSLYFYDALFQKYGLKKEESVMIGNEYQADIQGASNYGIDSMYVFTDQSGARPGALPENCRILKEIGEAFL